MVKPEDEPVARQPNYDPVRSRYFHAMLECLDLQDTGCLEQRRTRGNTRY